MNIDVLCVGVTSWDETFLIDHHPEPDEKMVAHSFHSCGGGPAANASVAAAKLGLKVAFAGYLGNDLYGEMHLAELESAGVYTDFVFWGKDPTPISTVLIKPGGERVLVNYRANHKYLQPEQIDFSGVHLKVVLFDGHEPDLSQFILDHKRENSTVSVLDAGSLHKGTEQLFQQVNYLVASLKFAAEVTGSSNPEIAIERLAKLNPNVVITLGPSGVIWKIAGNEGQLKSLPVKAVDTTGAGDVFHGIFAGCLAHDWDWLASLKYANAAAALSCTKIGGRTSIPDKEDIDRFYGQSYTE